MGGIQQHTRPSRLAGVLENFCFCILHRGLLIASIPSSEGNNNLNIHVIYTCTNYSSVVPHCSNFEVISDHETCPSAFLLALPRFIAACNHVLTSDESISLRTYVRTYVRLNQAWLKTDSPALFCGAVSIVAGETAEVTDIQLPGDKSCPKLTRYAIHPNHNTSGLCWRDETHEEAYARLPRQPHSAIHPHAPLAQAQAQHLPR